MAFGTERKISNIVSTCRYNIPPTEAFVLVNKAFKLGVAEIRA